MFWRGLVCLWLLLITSFSTKVFATYEGWTHLELGAGNYGADGHTKASQYMTVLMKIKEFSIVDSYIEQLDDQGLGDYKAEDQYGVLFWTLDELVKRYGDVGVFHVNDFYEEYAIYAKQKLMDYAARKGYDSIDIEVIPGDYQFIESETTLFPYGKDKYSSVHLKNTEVSFYNERMDGDLFFASEQSREETRSLLRKLANLSDDGLYLFIIYEISDFIPPEEKVEMIDRGIFYEATEDWEPVPYIFPEGYVIGKEKGRVFRIEPSLSQDGSKSLLIQSGTHTGTRGFQVDR
jgi:hypothetical protein